jgi:peptidoglycan/LPS O-acetylase OafA/YrhL
MRLGYRPALDGIRAIAILLVLALHGRLLAGGFLGVDLFFVLSGNHSPPAPGVEA